MNRYRLSLRVALAAAIGGVALFPGPTAAHAASSAAPAVHVSANQVVDASNHAVRLLGVDRSGTEYACIQGWGIFDGPSDAASVASIASWHVNAVRVPLNEDCWLGINGVPTQYGGANYQAAIAQYVSTLNASGIVAILDLHWTAPGTTAATGQYPMPDADHSIAFWSQVAAAYKSNAAVIFDLFNEPYPGNNSDTTAAWTCLRDGGSACTGQLTSASGRSLTYTAAGMQQLVDAVRSTGAHNVVMAAGLQYANTLDHWLQYRPTDAAGQLAASWHDYNFNGCASTSCWDTQVAPVIAQVPLITGEIGENDCSGQFITPLMSWLDAHGASYLAWTWDTWNCSSGPALITDYSGTPTAFGAAYRDHLAAQATVNAPAIGQVLDGWGGLHAVGSSPSVSATAYWPGWDIARDVATAPQSSGLGYVVDGFGGVHPFGGAPAVSASAYWPGWDIARALAVRADGRSGYVLDGFGGLHPFGGAPAVTVTAYWHGWDIARDVVLRADGVSGYVLDGWGGIHPFGGAPVLGTSGYWKGWDIARRLVLTSDGTGGYVLDGLGGVHAFGHAPAVTVSGSWVGQNIAKDVALSPNGVGGYVLDEYGAVHAFAGAVAVTTSATWPGWNIARALG